VRLRIFYVLDESVAIVRMVGIQYLESVIGMYDLWSKRYVWGEANLGVFVPFSFPFLAFCFYLDLFLDASGNLNPNDLCHDELSDWICHCCMENRKI
jgi:hypothetical protein